MNFRSSGGFQFHKDYFFKGSDRALWLEESLPVDERYAEINSIDLERHEIEEVFNSDNYDSMYVMSKEGMILYVRKG